MARCRISFEPSISVCTQQRFPLSGSQARSRVGRYSRTAPNSAFRWHAERLPLREIRSPLSRPAGHTIILAGLSRPVRPGGSILWSSPLAPCGVLDPLLSPHAEFTELAHGHQPGLASKVKGRLGYAPQRPPAPTQASESPWPRCWFGTRASPLHGSLPERTQLHHHVGYGGSGTCTLHA
jgi:hypothetical protein